MSTNGLSGLGVCVCVGGGGGGVNLRPPSPKASDMICK